jgi:hypothetical protein
MKEEKKKAQQVGQWTLESRRTERRGWKRKVSRRTAELFGDGTAVLVRGCVENLRWLFFAPVPSSVRLQLYHMYVAFTPLII